MPGQDAGRELLTAVGTLALVTLLAAYGTQGRSTAAHPVPAMASAPAPMAAAPEPPSLSGDAVASDDGSAVDMSLVSEGTILGRGPAACPTRHKLLVACGDERYAYDLPADGSAIAVPANMGNGEYEVSVMCEVGESEYVPVLSTEADVELPDADAPFLRPNMFCWYGPQSECMARAFRLAKGCGTDAEVAGKLFSYVDDTLSYDYAKASRLRGGSGYVPDPDETLSEGQGVCFDYASLLTAMLRSCGIPAKLATGTLQPTGEIHAWVEARIPSPMAPEGQDAGDGWTLLDPTLADWQGDGDGGEPALAYQKQHEY